MWSKAWMTFEGVGNSTHWHLVMTFFVSRQYKRVLPWTFGAGPRDIAGDVLGCIPLVYIWGLCTWAYCPNSMLQCYLKSMNWLVMIVLPLTFGIIEFLFGTAFNQQITYCTINHLKTFGTKTKLQVVTIDCTRSSIVLIVRSTHCLGCCCCWVVFLRFLHHVDGLSFVIFFYYLVPHFVFLSHDYHCWMYHLHLDLVSLYLHHCCDHFCLLVLRCLLYYYWDRLFPNFLTRKRCWLGFVRGISWFPRRPRLCWYWVLQSALYCFHRT